MNRKSYLNFDFIILASVICLVATGICFIYSSNIITGSKTHTSNEYIKQMIWGFVGLVFIFVFIFIDYRVLFDFSVYIYGFCILALIITLIWGKKINGTKSWLGIMGFGIQPSEFVKIGTIIALSYYCSVNRRNITSLAVFLKGILITLVPMCLILLQPDMGTAIVYPVIFLGIFFVAGASIRHLLFILSTGMLTFIFIIFSVLIKYVLKEEGSGILRLFFNFEIVKYLLLSCSLIVVLSGAAFFIYKKRYYYWCCYVFMIFFLSLFLSVAAGKILKLYQIMRLAIFLNPDIDYMGAGWNIIQSVIAIGSGGLWGKGFLMGTQSHYSYLPQQSTDFIFSVIAEEKGFIGALFILFLFLLIILRGIGIIVSSKDDFGSYLAAGITCMFFYHFMINIGMVMGIMPIMGIPLFFLSYGGSSLLTSMIGVGILINIYYRRYGFKI